MPSRPMRPCATPGCAELVKTGHCAKHAAAHKATLRREYQTYDRGRGNAAARGYDARWRTMRRAYLMEHPLCVVCQRNGLTVAATEVDHIQPHGGDPLLFADRGNWQALCKPCHSRKTLAETRGHASGRVERRADGIRYRR